MTIVATACLTFRATTLVSGIMACSVHTQAKVTQGNLLDTLAHRPGSVWLDSSLGLGDRGRTSLIATDPELDVSWHNGVITKRHSDGTCDKLECSDGMREILRMISIHDGPAVGYVSYEAMLPGLGIDSRHANATVPDIRFLLYSDATKIERDHDNIGRLTEPWISDLDSMSRRPTCVTPTLDRSTYLDKVAQIKDHIHEGDIYQANFTNRIDVETDLDPIEAYLRLRQFSPSPYSAYLNFGDYQILSSSPERMFKRDGDSITTGPIKGTIAAGDTENSSRANLKELLASEKDHAELLMIVDLERNDLGRIARVGSVEVDSLFRAEVYSSVIHLVADVRAQLRPGITYTDIFDALLPGGSITGAPKQRAVQIIDELEVTPRSVYTGVIGYIDGDQADFNIAIRTMIHRDGVYHVHAGGGIVADSEPEAEYQEMRLKTSAMMKALGADQENGQW